MGLSIHYSGQLKNINLLPQLVEELEDISKTLNWKTMPFDDDVDIPSEIVINEPRTADGQRIRLQGLFFTPPECETFFFSFSPNGHILSFLNIETVKMMGNDKWIYWQSVKTQFGTIETHITIISLLKYLKKKYFKTFEVNDEGYYWAKNDVNILKSRFETYSNLLEKVSGMLENIHISDNGNLEDIVEKITKMIKKGFSSDTESMN